MKFSVAECDNSVEFKISDFNCKYKNVIQNCFYNRVGESYVKNFPKDTKDIEVISANFIKYADEMFNQMAYFKPVPWEEALMAFIEKIEDKDIDWWLTGSCALCLRGIPVMPHDVDIMMDSKDIEKVREIFISSIVEPICDTGGWVTNHFGVAFLHARIDLAFNPQAWVDDPEPVDFGPFAMKNLEEIEWRGRYIKVPPLKLQLDVNRRRGRTDRVKLIDEYLRGSG